MVSEPEPPDAPEETLQDRERDGVPVPAVPRSFLFVALESDRPLSGGSRYLLDGIDEIVVTRGGERRATQSSTQGTKVLQLELPGRAVSGLHARIRRGPEGWTAEDAGSTNGIYVNGVRRDRATLADDDVLEIGRIFLLIRTHDVRDKRPVAEFTSAPVGPAAFATLVPSIAERWEALCRVAPSAVPVLISGETGTGKELLARAVHELSGRKGPLVAVNCGALAPGLVESQLFGHVRGAFSGALADAPGLVRAADHGTLFLDEVQELSASAQAALLRVVQEREVVPIGGVRPQRVEVRFVSTSPLSLDRAVRKGTFRADLFARLSGFSVALRPLRRRREDLGLLIAALLGKLGVTETERPRLAPELGHQLFLHDWPLNVRELEKLLERAWLLASDGLMSADEAFPPEPEPPSAQAPELGQPSLLSSEDQVLRERLLRELENAQGNVAEVARALGKAPMQVRRWLKRFAIDLSAYRSK